MPNVFRKMKKRLSFFAFTLFSLFVLSACTNPKSDFNVSDLVISASRDKPSAEFVSPEISATKFNAWFIRFNTDGGEGDVSVSARFNSSDDTEWREIELGCEEKICSGFATFKLADSYQFRVNLVGEADLSAFDFVIETRNFKAHRSFRFIPQTFAQFSNLGVISRESWGANSDYLVKRDVEVSGQSSAAWSERKKRCVLMQQEHPSEFKTDDRQIDTDTNGQKLHWPRTYSAEIHKIVIHATATDGEKDLNGDHEVNASDSAAEVRAIYYYHSMFRGWGDIGYQFLIDPFGNIYEGRSGGEYVVGAHAYCANTGTIGVSFIGNFEEKLPTAAALASGERLLGELANVYNIRLSSESKWHGKLKRNLVGHRDYGATRCPGDSLYAYLDELARRADIYASSHKSSDADFAYDILSSDSPARFNPLEEKSLKIKLKNIGKKEWPAGGEFHVASADRRKNRNGAEIAGGKDVVFKLPRRVSTGSAITLQIPVSAKMKAGRYRFGIMPSFNEELRKFFIVMTVVEPRLDYEFISAKHPPHPFAPNTEATAIVELKNKSNFTWKKSGKNYFYLGATKPEFRASLFVNGSSSELARLESDTLPGAVGKFKMELTSPEKSGRYQIYFAPAVMGFGYLPDYGMQFFTTVREPRFSADILDKSSGTELKFNPGETKNLFIEFHNTSQLEWDSECFELQILQKSGIQIDATELKLPQRVSQKSRVKIEFPVAAPLQAGKYRITLRPRWKNGKVKTISPIDFLVEVLPPQLTGKLVQKVKPFTLSRGDSRQVSFAYKNTGNVAWSSENLVLQRLPARASAFADKSWLSPLQPTKLSEKIVLPGEIGHFNFTVYKNSGAIHEIESFVPIVRGLGRVRGAAAKLEISSIDSVHSLISKEQSKESVSQQQEIQQSEAQGEVVPQEKKQQNQKTSSLPAISTLCGPTVRIRLSFDSDRVEIGGGELKLLNSRGEEYRRSNFEWFQLDRFSEGGVARIAPIGDTILEIINWKHHPAWSDTVNDNKFRGIIEVRRMGNELLVINELPLEDYLRGVAEPLSTDSDEKVKLLAVLARSYIAFYADLAHRKFPGMPYDGSDNPAEFQKYLGYNYELRGNMPSAVERTCGLAVTLEGNVVKTPYFTSSGGRTKTAAEAHWNITDFRFTKSVLDPWSCGGDLSSGELVCPQNARGHGVGVSGKGAEGLAKEGKSFSEILNYFFNDVSVSRIY